MTMKGEMDMDLAERIDTLSHELHETRELLISVKERLNGGPGKSTACERHAQDIREVSTRVTALERLVWKGLGVCTAVVFIAQIIAQYILKKL